MRRLIWCLGVLHAICLRTALGQNAVCPPEANDAIQRCVLPVKEYAEALGMSVRDASISGHMDRLLPQAQAVDMFQELCNIITRFEFCVKEPKNQCPKHIVLNLIDVSYGYLCNDGFEPFMDNANCLMQLDQDVNIRKCHETTMKSIVTVNQDNNTNVDQKMARTCRSLNYFTTCIEHHVRNKCGVIAWSVIVRVLKDTTTTLMANCVFTVQVPDIVQNTVNDRIDQPIGRTNEKSNHINNNAQSGGSQAWWPSGSMPQGSSLGGEGEVQNEAPVHKSGVAGNNGMKSGNQSNTVRRWTASVMNSIMLLLVFLFKSH